MRLLVILILDLCFTSEKSHGLPNTVATSRRRNPSRKSHSMSSSNSRSFSCSKCRPGSMYEPFICDFCYRGDEREEFSCNECKFGPSHSKRFICDRCETRTKPKEVDGSGCMRISHIQIVLFSYFVPLIFD